MAKKVKPKAKPAAKRARSMPLSDSQAKAAIQALRNDAGAKTYRKNKAKAKKKKKEVGDIDVFIQEHTC